MFYEVLNKEPVSATKRERVIEILTANKQKKNIVVASVVTDIEVLPNKLDIEDAYKEESYFGLFDGEHMINIPIDSNVIRLAREIRNRYFRPVPEGGGYCKMMDLGDSIHLATAAIQNVDEFHTRDDDDRKTKIPLISFYEWASETAICGRYALPIISPESDQGSFLDA